jgi:N-acetylmuramoyl-L-alanine amidase
MISDVYLDIQHAGKPAKPFDRGASNQNYFESQLCMMHAIEIQNQLRKHGIPVFLLTFGSYADRHELVNKYCEKYNSVYVALHLNAYKTNVANFTLFECCHGSMGQTFSIAKILAKKSNEILGIKLPDRTYAPNGVKTLKRGERGYTCISGVRCSAVLSEICFISNDYGLDVAVNFADKIAMVFVESIIEFNSLQGR